MCVYHCAQLSYTTQHRAVPISFPLTLQTSTRAQMLSIGGQWDHKGSQNFVNITQNSNMQINSSKTSVLVTTTRYTPGSNPNKLRTSSFGAGNSILRSIRPGLSKAESRMSILFVAIITCSHTITINQLSMTTHACQSVPPLLCQYNKITHTHNDYGESIRTKQCLIR